MAMKEVSVDELKEMRDNGEDFQLVDVREPNEFKICSLGGDEIPMSQIMTRYKEISKDKKVVKAAPFNPLSSLFTCINITCLGLITSCILYLLK